MHQLKKNLARALALACLFTLESAAQIRPTKAEERLKGIEQRKSLEEKSSVKDVIFRNVGPAVMSGRVSDLEVNPDDPTEFYVAYATGGLFHTTNNGQSFHPLFDNSDHLFMGDIAVNWKTGDIWVGTGEVNASRSSYAGTGVYKSSDKGKTWQWLGLPESHHIGKVLLHPSNPDIAWVAALGHLYSPNKERGVFKTTNGGKTWKHTLVSDENTGAVEMEIDPSNPDILYAATWYKTRSAWNFEESGKTSGIYKSTDGGNTWKMISTPGSGFPNGAGVGRIGLAVYPKNPSIIYAVLDNQFLKEEKDKKEPDSSYQLKDLKGLSQSGFAQLDEEKLNAFLKRNRFPREYTAASIKEKVANGTFKPSVIYDYLKGPNDDLLDASAIHGCEVYRSDNGGASWQKVDTGGLQNMYSTYGYYFGKIYVSPMNENKVFITGVPVMMSTDGGKSFKSIDGPNVHADHHALWINPNRDSHIINGNDGGINITYDNGAHWFKANSIPLGQFYSVTVDDEKPYNIYGGMQDNGVWYGPSNHRENLGWTDDGNYAWKRLGGGDGMMVQVDTRDNNTVYFGSQFGAYARSTRDRDRSAYRRIRPRHELGETPLRFNWESPILLSSHHQDVFYMGSNRFHRSLNQADTLINLSADLTKGGKPGDVPYGTLTWIAESPLQFGLLYTGSDDGLIHVSTNGGYSFSRIGEKLPQDLWVSCVTPSRYDTGRVYTSLNGYRNDYFTPLLYVSEDYGASWKSIANGLPPEPINTVKEDPKNPDIIYVGTDGGLYVSLDRGKSYMAFGESLPKIPVHDIAFQERENEIVVATHGRSIYVAKLEKVQAAK